MQLWIVFLDMRRDVQEVFRMTPHEKQVMMFSATLPKDIRPVCKKFMQDVNILPYYNVAVAAWALLLADQCRQHHRCLEMVLMSAWVLWEVVESWAVGLFGGILYRLLLMLVEIMLKAKSSVCLVILIIVLKAYLLLSESFLVEEFCWGSLVCYYKWLCRFWEVWFCNVYNKRMIVVDHAQAISRALLVSPKSCSGKTSTASQKLLMLQPCNLRFWSQKVLGVQHERPENCCIYCGVCQHTTCDLVKACSRCCFSSPSATSEYLRHSWCADDPPTVP